MAATPVPLIIDGAEVHLEDAFDVVSPSTGQTLHRCSDASPSHALQAVDAAARAFGTWSQRTPGERRDVFRRAADVIDRRADELKAYLMDETAADDFWAGFNVMLGRECVLGCAGHVMALEGRIPSLQDPAIGGLVVKEPYGVVLAMSPWNAPYVLGFRAVAWAIAAGNTVVFKGSERSPRTLWAICSVFEEAGLPPGVLNYVACSPGNAPAVARAAIEVPAVKKVNFTGSAAVGRAVAQMAGAALKPVLLELGGKAPAVVCEDADLEVAARECALGAFVYAGQVCMSTERVLVRREVRAAFEERLRAWIDQLTPDAPVLIAEGAAARNAALVRDALGKGATLVAGDPAAAEGRRMRPVVLGGVRPGMDVYLEESFGPTVSLMEVGSDEEALEIANDTEYGLSASVFSRDLRRALRVARRIETGAVHINRMSVQDEAALPHGGAKASGFGRFNGSLEEWVRTKNITYDL